MPYTFDPIFAVDPGNTANIAANAVVTIFEPGDTAQTPLVLTTPTGLSFPNPVTTSGSGHAGAFQHETLGRVAWAGGGFTGFFTAHDSIKQEAVAAKEAAQTAAMNAGSAAIAEVAERLAAGEFKGEPGRDGSNVVPTAEAIATEIETPGTPAHTALSATIAESLDPGKDALRWFRNQLGSVATSPIDVVAVGDSTTEGARATTAAGRWIDQVIAKLRERYQAGPGGAGYRPIIYSPGIPFAGATWDYREGAESVTLAADSFDGASGELNGRATPTGAKIWSSPAGVYSLSGGNAVSSTEAAGVAYINGLTNDDRETIFNFKIGTLTATNQAVRIFGMSDGTDRVYLEATVNAAASPLSSWRLGKRIDAVNTDVVTWTPASLAAPSGQEVAVAFKVEGLTVTVVVNGETRTMTLTQAEKDTIVGGQIAIQNPGTGSQIHDVTATTLGGTGTQVFPTMRTTHGLGLRCLSIGNTGDVDRAVTNFTGAAVDVIFTKQSGGGTLDVSVDGTITSVNTAAATEENGVKHRVGGLTAGNHTLKLSSTGAVLVEGVMVYDGDESNGIRLWEGGHVGYNTASFATNTEWSDSLKAVMTPDLAFVALGLNDFKAQTIPPATFKANLFAIIAEIREANPHVSVVLHNSWERGDVASPTYPWSGFVAAIDEIAAADPGVMLVDLNGELLGWNLVDPAYRTIWDVDTVHLSPAGYVRAATVIADAI